MELLEEFVPWTTKRFKILPKIDCHLVSLERSTKRLSFKPFRKLEPILLRRVVLNVSDTKSSLLILVNGISR
jgi:hypothetical protein